MTVAKNILPGSLVGPLAPAGIGAARVFRGAVASQAAMLALSSSLTGDWCTRTDLSGQVFELTTAGPATVGNWTSYPAGGVTTIVNDLTTGGAGAALAAAQGVALKAITDANTTAIGSKADSTATASAINAKATDVIAAISVASAADVANGDTMVGAFGKLQAKWTALATSVRAVVLTGLSTATNSAALATDTVLVAIGKLQAQITAVFGIAAEDVATTTYTFVAADMGKIKRFTNAAGCAATVPTALGTGWNCSVMQGSGAGTVTIVQGASTAVTSLDGTLTTSGPKAIVSIIPQALDSYIVVGGLTNSVASLNAVQAFTKNQSVTPVSLIDAVTIATDASLSNTFKLTMLATGRAMGTPSNPTDGMVCNWIVNSGAGGFAMTWAPAFDFGGAGAPTHSTTASKEDLVSGVYSAGTSKWLSTFRKGS